MTLYGYARVSVREPEGKNLDLRTGYLLITQHFVGEQSIRPLGPLYPAC